MKTINTFIRIVLGIAIAFSGINKFGHWLNASFMQDAMAFIVDLSNIGGGFIINAIAVLEILIGLALILNLYTTLASLVLLPLIVSILIFHIFLDLSGIAIAVIVFAMNVYLIIMNRNKFSGILKPV